MSDENITAEIAMNPYRQYFPGPEVFSVYLSVRCKHDNGIPSSSGAGDAGMENAQTLEKTVHSIKTAFLSQTGNHLLIKWIIDRWFFGPKVSDLGNLTL